MLRFRYFLPVVLLAATLPLSGLAAENWGLCRVPAIVYAGSGEPAASETRVEAQSIVSDDSETLRLRGDVRLLRGQQKISAAEVVINKSSDRISASGDVVYEDPSYRLSSPDIVVDNRNNEALFQRPTFELYGRHARGEAAEIRRLDQQRSRFQDLVYTSCDPADRDWHMRASEMEINTESGRGSATHARLYFQEIPFFYLPYFQFPIDDRRMSGLLTPGIGYNESNGSSLLMPVYWNIAPNYDMTITPAWFGKRGAQLNTENRYLFASHSGQLDLSYLDDDEIDDSRWFQQWRHRASLGGGASADLLLAEVSDDEIFDDFASLAPEYNNTRHLERHFTLAGGGNIWSAELLWQDYQTLDDDTEIEDRPYNRLPRLFIDAQPGAWAYGIRSPVQLEAVEFDRDDSVTGKRTHLVSTLNWRASDSWFFLAPELQLAFTDYRLDDTAGDDSLHRGLPTLAIDSGLIFEREAGSKNQWLQTLEPRLYFLHTPFEDQDDIPDFDTSINSRTYRNLFRNNRFTGADRIGDANQVTLGIASRVFDNDSGEELVHFRTGQIFYFKDRRVSLDGIREDSDKSDVITELDVWPNARVRLAARLVYEQAGNELNDRDLSVNYSDDGFAANFGYYFSEDELEQALVSMVYPINERWTFVAKYHQSLKFEETVENLLGFNYESCCWGLKILAGQEGDEDEDFSETENSIYFEFTLKGLSSAGRDIDAQLQEAIPGYQRQF